MPTFLATRSGPAWPHPLRLSGLLVVVVRLCCYNNPVDWVVYNEQKFLARSFGDWEVQGQDANTGEAFLLHHHVAGGWAR